MKFHAGLQWVGRVSGSGHMKVSSCQFSFPGLLFSKVNSSGVISGKIKEALKLKTVKRWRIADTPSPSCSGHARLWQHWGVFEPVLGGQKLKDLDWNNRTVLKIKFIQIIKKIHTCTKTHSHTHTPSPSDNNWNFSRKTISCLGMRQMEDLEKPQKTFRMGLTCWTYKVMEVKV